MSLVSFFSLLGGIGLFLFGMSFMTNGLKNAAGDQLKAILERATSNRFVAVFVGFLVTILAQCSAATDMMVIGFVNSGLMTLLQAVGVIMGANIGTTITAQITAFNIGVYAPLIVFIGTILYLFINKTIVKHVGSIIMGFGMLFFGLSIVKNAIKPLADSPEFAQFLSGLENPFLAILFGVLFTAMLQSSSSATVIVQTFAMQGIIEFELAVYLVIGAAIGSVTPNLLASLTTNRNGKRTACLNLIFNLCRASLIVLLISIIPGFLDFIVSLSPDNVGRQVANAHSMFAIIAVLAFFPFAPFIVKLSQKLIPVRPEETQSLKDRELIYMQEGNLPPAVALQQAQREITRMGKLASNNLKLAVKCFFEQDQKLIQQIEDNENTINFLTHAITQRLVKIRTFNMTGHERNKITQMTFTVSDIERIGDHAENVAEYASQLATQKSKLSDEAIEELKTMAEAVTHALDFCLDIFENETFENLAEAEKQEQHVDELEKVNLNRHIARLLNRQCDPLAGVIFTNMSSDLERCSDHAINIAFALHEHNFDLNSK
ncbi:MAG: Na/Pi cotransporter family protein [Proteobacteria bacterium]|nr:Na/Pi cotransporter family protein [Pseudomonadota bacterium]